MGKLLMKTELLNMGWTRSMIDKLLPPPIEKTNPNYPRGSPMKLYDSDIVRAAMLTEEYRREREKADKRRYKKPKSTLDPKTLWQVKIYRDFLVAISNDELQNMEVSELEQKYEQLKNRREN